MKETRTYIVTPPMRKYEIIYKGLASKSLDAQLANTVGLSGYALFVVNDNLGKTVHIELLDSSQLPSIHGQSYKPRD